MPARNGGFSEAGLRRLRDTMAGFVHRRDVPGLVLLLAHEGDVHVEAIGSKSADQDDPIRRDTIFRISSMTKPIIALATMILVEDGKLSLDEPVDRLLPELADRSVVTRLDSTLDETVPAQRAIEVRDLPTMLMGFGQQMLPSQHYPILQAATELRLGMGPPAPATMPPPEEWLRRLGSLPLMYHPGERWLYNIEFDVLGVLVQRAAGRPLEEFLRQRIFLPLSMTDTGFSVPANKLDRLVESHWAPSSQGSFEIFDSARDGQWSTPPAFPSGAGGLVSTVDDYLAFARLLQNGGRAGGKPILSDRAVEAMTADQLSEDQKSGAGPILDENLGWGFGLSVLNGKEETGAEAGSFGWDGGLGTSWRTDPRRGLTTIVMTQCLPISVDLCQELRRLAYLALEG